MSHPERQTATGAPAEPPTHIEKGSAAFLRTNLALFCGGFATFALLYCVQPMMPVLAQAFAISAAQASLVLSVSTLALAVGLLFTGSLSDALGRKRVMGVSLLCAALFTLASAAMTRWELVLLMRVLVGLSLSGLTAVAMTYLSEEIHPAHTGLAVGLYIGGNAIGGMCGRLVAGVMVDYLSWHWVLACIGLLALLAGLVFWRLLPESRHFRPRPITLGNLAGGFALHLRDARLPVLFVEAFLLMGSLVTFFNYIGFHLLQAPYHLSQAAVGMLSVVYLSGTYSSAMAGSLADRVGRQKVLWVMILLMLVGFGLTLLAPLPLILLGMLLFTFGFFGAHSVASSWVGRRATQARGQAASLYQAFYYTGSGVAGTLGGLFWHQAGWYGIGLFVGGMLVLALVLAIGLARRPLGEAGTCPGGPR
ncbi:MFS transporter [Metapseudomonas otitidis]|uniref:MFS transporter n=1 Tax=Metapseudomonas otitidis TaxID=319939 RepID=UPI001F0CDCB5|nr:MFS transporter [Pseudomonas otitidis]